MLIENIASRTRVPAASLLAIARNASKRYKVYEIPKRNGGMREISHPSKALKAVQRWLTRHILGLAPVHPAATAYRRGMGIKENARRHVESSYTLRMDFSNFFPSFDSNSISQYLSWLLEMNGISHNGNDIHFLVRIFCKDGRLTIGAPSSPALTNAMMYDFDDEVSVFCDANDVIYTRYADDIFFSSSVQGKLAEVENFVQQVVASTKLPHLVINAEKTRHLSRAKHRSVTGLILTPDGRVSLGRDRKRKIRSMVYLMRSGQLPPPEVGYLKGMIAFANDIEPEFIVGISRKYGFDAMKWVKTV